MKGGENNMVTIPVKGMVTNDDDAPIYRDFLGMTVVSPQDVLDSLPDDGSPVTLDIASNGGEVDPATEIYTALKNYSGDVTAQISANAYSAATIVAMGAGKVQISPGARMMIHNAASGAEGNYHDMDRASNMLQTVNQSIAAIYADKTGRPVDEFLGLMDKESWLSAQDAIDLGLVDEVMSFEPVTNLAKPPLVNHHSITKIKDLISENQKLKNTTSQISEHEKLVQAKMAIFYGKDENTND